MHLVFIALLGFLSLGAGAPLPWSHASVARSAPASVPAAAPHKAPAPPPASMDGGLGGQPSH